MPHEIIATGMQPLVIWLIVNYEFSFDIFQPDRNRIYRVVIDLNYRAGGAFFVAGVKNPMPEAGLHQFYQSDDGAGFLTREGDRDPKDHGQLHAAIDGAIPGRDLFADDRGDAVVGVDRPTAAPGICGLEFGVQERCDPYLFSSLCTRLEEIRL